MSQIFLPTVPIHFEPPKENNLLTKDKRGCPKVCFIQRSHCSRHSLQEKIDFYEQNFHKPTANQQSHHTLLNFQQKKSSVNALLFVKVVRFTPCCRTILLCIKWPQRFDSSRLLYKHIQAHTLIQPTELRALEHNLSIGSC